jgi:uncharacterized protein involved in outer membrane biogenesis
MKKRRFKRNFKIVIFIILTFIFLVTFLNNYLLPIKLKNYLQASLVNTLKKPVYFEKLGFNIFRGVVIDNITVFKTQEKKEAFLSAERVSFNPLLLPLIKKKLIITQLIIDKLNIELERNKQGKLNLIEILASKSEEEKPGKFSITVTDFEIKNSTITLEDSLPPEPQTTIFENVNASAGFALPAKVKFNFNSSLKDKARNISLKGTYYFSNKYLDLNLNCLNLNLYKFSPYFKDKFPISIENDQTDIAASIVLDSSKKLSIEGTTYLDDTQATFKSLTLGGNLVIKGRGTYDLKNNAISEAKGTIILRDDSLEGVLYVNTLKNLKGSITFTKQGLFIKDLSGKAIGMPLDFEGYFKNFKYPELKLTVKSDLKLQETINQLPPRFSEKLKNIKVSGDTVLRLAFEGKLKEFWTLDFTGKAELTDVVIESTQPAVEIKNIDSKLHFTKDELSIDNLTMEFRGDTYSATAIVRGFEQPLLDFKLTSENLFTTGRVKFLPQVAQLENINGKYKGVDFEVSGQVSNLTDPMLNIYAKLSSKIEKLKNAFPQFEKIIQKYKLAGAIKSTLYFEGKAAEPLNGFAKIKASSPQISIANFKIEAVNLSGQLQQKNLFIDELSGSIYDGNLTLNTITELANIKQPKFQANLNISKVDLSKLIKDTKLKDKKIKGIGALKCSLRGVLNNPKSFVGSGWLSIRDGYLWETPLLNRLASFLDIPELKDVVFKEAFANFQIQNSRIVTQDFTLLSDQVAMIATGALGFDSGLDFLIQTQFSEDFYKTLVDKGSIAPIFLETIAKYALSVKLTGTLAEPKFKLKPIAFEEILKEGIFKGLEKIFQ